MKARHYERIPFEDERLPIRINYDSVLPAKNKKPEPFSWHEQIEFLVFRRGEAAVYCSDRRIRARAGEVVLINPFEMHRVEPLGETGYDCVMIDSSLYLSDPHGICETRYFDLLTDSHVCFSNHLVGDGEVLFYLNGLCREMKQREFSYELAVKSHVFGLFGVLFRRHVPEGSVFFRMAENLEHYERIKPALDRMNAQLSQRITLRELASACNVSEAHFCRLFRQITSATPMQYLTDLRLSRSAQLLQRTDRSVSEIAWETGFESPGYFCRRFKEKYGVSPRQLRRRKGENENESK